MDELNPNGFSEEDEYHIRKDAVYTLPISGKNWCIKTPLTSINQTEDTSPSNTADNRATSTEGITFFYYLPLNNNLFPYLSLVIF